VEIWEDEKRDRNHSPPKNKLVQDSERNEETGYPDPDSNKTKKTIPRNPTKPARTSRKKKSCK
jgi:hypothetical protein